MSPERQEAEAKVFRKLVTKGIRGSVMNLCEFNWENLNDQDKLIMGPKIEFIKKRQEMRHLINQ